MRWQIKLLRNTAFMLLPFPHAARRFMRGFFPYPAEIDEWTLEQGLRQVEMLRSAGCDVRGKTVLELGTGWMPVIPLIFRLAGCENLILIDSQRLLDADLMARVVTNLMKYSNSIASRLGVSAEQVERQLRIPDERSLPAIFRHFGIDYRAPFDARRTALPDRSVDVVTSRAVLEHIPPPVIAEIFGEAHRILADAGCMCHIVDNSDHWAQDDRSITRVNFLKFEDSLWKRLTINPLDYQNRLRHFEYLRIARQAGFEIALDHSPPDAQQIENLKRLGICSRYSAIPLDELAVITSYFVARKAAKANL